jgi:3-oxoacyl-[acyl-carrier-protein] synthase III
MPSPDEPTSHDTTRQLTLVKQEQRWVFRYAPGEEKQLIEQLIAQARDPASRLDWFDVAVLSHQMGEHMAGKLEQIKQA